MNPLEAPDWARHNPRVLAAWADTERRGDQLLFVAPIVGLPLLAAAYLGIPQTPVPAMIVAAALLAAIGYLRLGKWRLRHRSVIWLHGSLRQKVVHQSTQSTTREESRRHYLVLDVRDARQLARDGSMGAGAASGGRLATTAGIFERVQEGDVLWAAVMPHDGAIYFVVTADGELVS